MYQLDGKPVNIYADLVIGSGDDAITIPAGSLMDQATRDQYGIVEVPDPELGDPRFYWNTSDGPILKDIQLIADEKIRELETSRIILQGSGVLVGTNVFSTDPAEVSNLYNHYSNLKDGLISTIQYKSLSGWVDLDLDQMRTVITAVLNHNNGCAALERAKRSEIAQLVDAGDSESLINLNVRLSA